MNLSTNDQSRLVAATHGCLPIAATPLLELELSQFLLAQHGRQGVISLYGQYVHGESCLDGLMRRAIWRALCHGCGDSITVDPGAVFSHGETFDIGSGVKIGRFCVIQGRHDGRCIIGERTWLGSHVFLDARDLVIGQSVGMGPGVKILGSSHLEEPLDRPIIANDLLIQPVVIGNGVDVGVNAVILPGVTIGDGAIIGAGAVVREDVAAGAVVVGVPARFLRWRGKNESFPSP